MYVVLSLYFIDTTPCNVHITIIMYSKKSFLFYFRVRLIFIIMGPYIEAVLNREDCGSKCVQLQSGDHNAL